MALVMVDQGQNNKAKLSCPRGNKAQLTKPRETNERTTHPPCFNKTGENYVTKMAVYLYCSGSKWRRGEPAATTLLPSWLLLFLVVSWLQPITGQGAELSTNHALATARRLILHTTLAEHRTDKECKERKTENTGHIHIGDNLKTKMASLITIRFK